MATVNELRAILPAIPETRRDFATSLVSYFDTHNRWSPRQQYFVDQMVAQYTAPAAAPAAPTTTQWNALPADGVSTVLGWFGNVRRISPLARARVTFPRASVGAGLRLAAPSNTSRYSAADTFFVYREREYIGRVERGMWQGRNDPTILNDLRAVLANPLQATITAGRATGTCCFCARALTDDRSVSVGYGPICAGHYGLPWGDTSNDVIRATNIHGQSMEPLGRLADERRARATPPAPRAPAAPGRPDLPSFSDGGPDDEDRQFM